MFTRFYLVSNSARKCQKIGQNEICQDRLLATKCQKWLSGILKFRRQHYVFVESWWWSWYCLCGGKLDNPTGKPQDTCPTLWVSLLKNQSEIVMFQFFSDRPEVWMTCARSSTNPKSMIELNWIKTDCQLVRFRIRRTILSILNP